MHLKKTSLSVEKRERRTMSRSLQNLTVATIKIIKGKTHCLQFPFEAISQTEFLSFDQLSQSSHIYLVGETGIPSPHGTVHSTRPPGAPRHHPQLTSGTRSAFHRSQAPASDPNSHSHPLRRPSGSRSITRNLRLEQVKGPAQSSQPANEELGWC